MQQLLHRFGGAQRRLAILTAQAGARRVLSAGTVRSGRTSSSRRWLVRMRSPWIRTALMAMISSLRMFRPVVSQSSATHSSGGGASHMKRKRASPRWCSIQARCRRCHQKTGDPGHNMSSPVTLLQLRAQALHHGQGVLEQVAVEAVQARHRHLARHRTVRRQVGQARREPQAP